MEGKQKFDYETAGKTENKGDANIQDMISKVLQIIFGILMAIFHM